MRSLYKYLFVCLMSVLLAGTRLTARELGLGNGEFTSVVRYSGHRIHSAVWTLGNEVVSSGSGAPLFEICINGRVFRSSDPVWKFAGARSAHLSNGGTLITYRFHGRKTLDGLALEWDREFFPTGAFVRERLRLRSQSGRQLRLTLKDGKQHFIFPRYSFCSEGPVTATELSMAHFTGKVNPLARKMNHPDTVSFVLGEEALQVKGPFLITEDRALRTICSYEHASQDETYMTPGSICKDSAGNDGYQGTKGRLDVMTDDDLWFIALEASAARGAVTLSNRIRRGGYIDGEPIPGDGWYETVWSTVTLQRPDEDKWAAVGEYLYERITEHKLSRKGHFYYNTWGMQRDMPKDSLYLVMTEQRLLREIDHAHEMGLDCFVIDDGWESMFGDWTPHPVRLPRGLTPLVDRLLSYGMTPGIWISLAGANFDSERTRQHPQWLVRDMEGKPVKGQWRNPVYDIVGPVYDLLLEDFKALTDQGIRYFKWDAFNTFSSALEGLSHGDSSAGRRERIDRYNYLAPFYVVRLMRELREYCPDVVIENDLTEHERCMIGLMPLQEGKLYFVNNGASKYKDYSSYRSRSLRGVINEYAFFMPQELFTYAMFPQDQAGCSIYNTTSMLSAGHGFWGNLDMTTAGQRAAICSLVTKAKRVLPYVEGRLVEVRGRVDASPELYIQRNPDNGYALVTAFAREAVVEEVTVQLPVEKVLGALGHPFRLSGEGVVLPLSLRGGDSCASAFVLGGGERGVRLLSSTGPLEDIRLDRVGIYIKAAGDAHVQLALPSGQVKEFDLAAGSGVTISL